MVLIQRLGRFENWGLPPEERKEKREEERRRVVGVRWVFVACLRVVRRGVGVVRGRGGGGGEGVEEMEMEERNRLERMHTQRRARQKSLASRKRDILREIEKLKAEGSFSSSSSSSSLVSSGQAGRERDAPVLDFSIDLSQIEKRDGNTYDVEAQPPHPHPHPHPQSSTTSAQIRKLQEELQQLENNPEAASITSNIPTQTQSSKPLPELPHFNPRLHTQQLPQTPSFENINLDSPPSGGTVTDSENDTTLVNTSQRNHPIFHHPSLTNGRLNTPASQGGGFPSGQGGAQRRHPSQAEPNDRANPRPAFPHQETPRTLGNKWQHNDSDNDNDVAGDEEAIFTLFASRAREFEAGDPVPRRRVRAPPAENYGAAEDVPGFSVPAGPMRPWTPRVGDEGRLANDYMEERRVAGENVEGRRGGNQELPVVERPENAHIPRKTDPGGTFLIGDSDDEAEKRI